MLLVIPSIVVLADNSIHSSMFISNLQNRSAAFQQYAVVKAAVTTKVRLSFHSVFINA